MKKLFATTAAVALMAGSAMAEEIKLGVLLGFTGPIESTVAHMAPAAHMAIKEVSDSGKLLGGATVVGINGDTTCVDSGAATAAAERLITSDGVKGIIGGDCSGVTGAVLTNVAVPNGVVMISPSATSPGLSHMNNEDNGLFFRTAPSDARQGVVMTEVLMEQDIKEVAVTYTNNDYGKGLADAFQAAYEAAGGKVTINAAHEDGKADYSAEVGALAAAGGQRLVVAGYVDQGGNGIVRAAIDTGAFDTFHFPDGMISDQLVKNFGSEIDGSSGQHPSPSEELAARFKEVADAAGGDWEPTTPFAPESYDAAALIMLAMQAAGSTDANVYKDKIIEVANAPGEKINSGELAKGLEILAAGGDIDYVGGTGVELVGPGEAAGNYREIMIEGGTDKTVRYR
ncbi:ABC transporter substrate-binding protein [Alisedimentitalea sp. MJ-SS2]|uniref:ABC transporter substrate-binding protein n=1 Tax=Aliisedimentitalea sp. MJ-SS2 TaxID=3049795 RepID=UPI00291598C5|nr:ABC transporter substrate-binding protein [Alisedimentitalea sp. MJ-SS2]MDU8926915.1 ABC transporter substrate-binding protein [Alisedimentitalea sp. MJ-SS2]